MLGALREGLKPITTVEDMYERWGDKFPLNFKRFEGVDISLVTKALEMSKAPQIVMRSGRWVMARGPIGYGPLCIWRSSFENEFKDIVPYCLVPGGPLELDWSGTRTKLMHKIHDWCLEVGRFHCVFVGDQAIDSEIDVLVPREGDGVLLQVWFNDLNK